MKMIIKTTTIVVIILLTCNQVIAENAKINFVRVSNTGSVIGTAARVAPSSPGLQTNPRVEFSNGSFLAVWQDMSGTDYYKILGARISTDGQLIDQIPIAISSGTRTHALPDVAAVDDGFVVVWHGFEGTNRFPKVYITKVSQNGSVDTPTLIADGSNPKIAWNGKEYLVVYNSVRGSGKTVRWIRLDESFNLLYVSGKGFVWSLSKSEQFHSVCSMPDSEDGWVILLSGDPGNQWNRTIGKQRTISIMPDGSIAADSPTYSTAPNDEKIVNSKAPENWIDTSYGSTETPRPWPWGGNELSQNGDGLVAIWQRSHQPGGRPYGFGLNNSDLIVGRLDGWHLLDRPGIPVSDSTTSEERHPSLAGNGTGTLLAVYEKSTDGYAEIASRLLSVDTTVNVNSEVILKSYDSGSLRRANPDVAYGANLFLVVWQDGYRGHPAVPGAGPGN